MQGPPSRRLAVETGLARLLEAPDSWLRGRSFGLVTNNAARAPDGRPAHLALAKLCPGQLRALMAPEHGLHATAAAGVNITAGLLPGGLRVHSLYGPSSKRPSGSMLHGLDLLVLDLQDVGIRYYTYLSTMLLCLDAVAERGLSLLVLDRPNPLGGLIVEGPGVDPGYESFVSSFDVPIRHGMTLGELAKMAVAERGLPGSCLEVLPMTGWRREMLWRDTGLVWYPPSPGARSINMVSLYQATCLIEGTTLSEGRGTDAPFELVGAPWVNEFRFAGLLSDMGRSYGDGWPLVTPVCFEPRQGKWAGTHCHGVRLEAEPGGVPLLFGFALLVAARQQDPVAFAWRQAGEPSRGTGLHIDQLAGGPWLRLAVEAGAAPHEVEAAWSERQDVHRRAAAQHLLYESTDDPSGQLPGPRVLPSYGPSRPALAAAAGSPPEARSTAAPLDLAPPAEVVGAIAASARRAVDAVDAAADAIGLAIEQIVVRLRRGGRLIYVGAGTSGRLGLLDASECGPTFGALPGQVLAVIAGGADALSAPQEGAEDDRQAAESDMRLAGVGPKDAVVGIAASGSTPYTVAALEAAGRAGALTVALVSTRGSQLAAVAEMPIEVPCGDEPLRGSSRLGAGTAQKVALNAISTGAFARLGLVHGDLMVGVQPLNAKLRARAARIIAELAGCSLGAATEALLGAIAYDRRLAVRLAVLHVALGISWPEAAGLLQATGGSLRAALAKGGAALP